MIPTASILPGRGAGGRPVLSAPSGGGACAGKRQQKGTAPSPAGTDRNSRFPLPLGGSAVSSGTSRSGGSYAFCYMQQYGLASASMSATVNSSGLVRYSHIIPQFITNRNGQTANIPVTDEKTGRMWRETGQNARSRQQKQGAKDLRRGQRRQLRRRRPAACGTVRGRSDGTGGRSKAAATKGPWADCSRRSAPRCRSWAP